MDLTDISKVASRKRMNTDAEKLREKVSRETAKIIKLKVAQDTAYWDLKEKLQQLEANHERLQQNMVEVQMQHEATSGQYQHELRLRPDTLNKLSGTRGICDVLEEYGDRLRRSVARCRADQQALSAAYGACGARVRRLASEGARAQAAGQARRDAERERAERHDADARRLALALEQLGEARARLEALDEARRDLAERLDSCAADLRRREEAAAAGERAAREADARAEHWRRATDALEAELRAERERGEEARVALATVGERSAELRRDLRAAAERAAADLQRLERAAAELAEAKSAIDQLKLELTQITDDRTKMENIINDGNQRLKMAETEIASMRDNAAKIEASRQELSAALSGAEQRCGALEERAHERARALAAQEGALRDERERRAACETRISELVAEAAERSRELDVKTGTITRLMGDLKAEAEARARADAALGLARRTHEAERERAAANSARLEQALRDKDDELAAQMKVILDIRSEKERLQEKIGGMQATIDNIQKELSGPAPAPAGERATRDADMLYGFLSDGSVDGDQLDARAVGRRFEALARGDLPLHALRPPPAHGTVSLSQVKKHLKMKSRTFFKNKRLESKAKKLEE